MMDRSDRKDDRRRREDSRDRRPRYERERSRSPHFRDRRDERRRERTPPRGPPRGPARRDDRDRERDRGRDRPRDRDRQPSRSPPPARRNYDRAPPRAPPDSRLNDPSRGGRANEKPLADTEMLDDEDSDAEMLRIMGFKDFRTTKNTKVPGNDKNYAVSKVKTAEYRQYMNRTGGFNRPLSPSRV